MFLTPISILLKPVLQGQGGYGSGSKRDSGLEFPRVEETPQGVLFVSLKYEESGFSGDGGDSADDHSEKGD